MKRWNSSKLTDIYEDLMFLKQQGQLGFAGERELEMCELYLFGIN